MPICKTKCTRKQWIRIVKPSFVPDAENYEVDNSEVVLSVRASVKTSSGIIFMNGVNIDTGITHTFEIKYVKRPAIEKNHKIFFKGEIYRIESIENVNELDEVLKIKASKRGDETIVANIF